MKILKSKKEGFLQWIPAIYILGLGFFNSFIFYKYLILYDILF